MKVPHSEHFDVVVVGGGAAGLMAAGCAAARGKRVVLLEKNKTLGKKLAISGGGRCNITNAEKQVKTLLAHYGASEQFLYSAFSEFGVADTFAFFEGKSLPLKVEARQRAFPQSECSQDVIKTLVRYLEAGAVTVCCGTAVTEVVRAHGAVQKVIAGGKEYTGDSYIFATGGVSHPETGSTGDGFAWLRACGHTIKDPTPTIVPLRVPDAWVRALHGKVLPQAKITFYQEGAKKFTNTGDILLTHFGISGPTILNSSGRVADLLHEGPVTATVDLFPQYNIGELDSFFRSHFDAHKNKALKNVARVFLPAGTAEVLLSCVSQLDQEKKTHSITKEERRALVDVCKTLPIHIEGLMGYDRAVVADGGVSLTEIDMRTMRSLKIANAFVVGDLLDVTRPSGGYSLQLCWTTGFVAGNNA